MIDKHQKRIDKTYYQYSLPDFFTLYDEKEIKNKVEKKVHKAFLLDFFAMLFKEMVDEKWTFYLPKRLGFLTIVSAKSNLKALPIDKARMEKGKMPRLTNDHSHGRTYRVKWVKKFVRFPNSKYYKFKTWKSDHSFKKYGVGSKAIWKMITDCAKDPDRKLLP